MLQLKNVCKSYTTGGFTQIALDDVSIAFRDNEFAAILGPSGSGKTTMLNIIGGLDHCDSGDLVIDGISTKNYTDRDWDTFRNNRIGFVFQSYNLIPHQSVLANVELALTLSGVEREERRKRAIEVLERVGLTDHIKKRPNQLSGGQMQRVAIARALVNDPEILLADEPTGALDSKTSIQIMDLLTEIARDRLVVMVTHNPELADTYATRIVNLADGHITADSDPFVPTPADLAKISTKKIRRSSMNFLTALSLSFNNLMTKKGRTIMTAFAGSIGIIGIASILALANGVNNYIERVEEQTLTSYPLQINSTGFDITSMIMSADTEYHEDEAAAKEASKSAAENGGQPELQSEDTVIGEFSIINKMFDSVNSNDLASLKAYLDNGDSNIEKYAKDIEYIYNVVPQVYLVDTSDNANVKKVNPDTTFEKMGMGTNTFSQAMMGSMNTANIFSEMIGSVDMMQENYDLKAGKWATNANECMLVLKKTGKVDDFTLYVLGLRDRTKLDEMAKAFVNGEEIKTDIGDGRQFTYKDFLNLKMKVVSAANYYKYDEEFGVWVDKSTDDEYVAELINNGIDLSICGIAQLKEDKSATQNTIVYTPALTQKLISMAGTTQIVKDQLANPARDVFNGKLFSEENEKGESDFNMGNLFSIDEDALQRAFTVDQSKLQIDTSALSGGMDPSAMPQMPPMTDAVNPEAFARGSAALTMGYFAWCSTPPAKNPGDAANYQAYMQTADAQRIMAEAVAGTVNAQAMQQAVGAYVQELTGAIQQQTQAAMAKAMEQLSSNMATAMQIDQEAFKQAFKFDLSEDELSELIMSMMAAEDASFDGNLAKLGYAQLEKPYGIDIFAKDFEAKQKIIDILDAYNERMNNNGEESKAISYTDLVGTLMKSVTTIIDMISYVLVAFVSISLIVSSIMIGIITYISVLERKKEIGILRAIGASKRNVGQIFNAETVIEGLIAGVLGVGLTALVCVPVSALVYALFDVPNVALLPWQAGVTLIIISVLLSLIAGLIPARSASKNDPVESLRSE